MADLSTIFALAIQNYKKQLGINVRTSTEFLSLLNKKSLKNSYLGGTAITQPLMSGLNNTLQPYTMDDKRNMEQQKGFTQASFPWKLHDITITVYKEEELKVSGEAELVNLAKAKLQQAEISLKKGINQYLLAPGTAVNTINGSRFPLHGIPAIIADDPTTNPLPAGYDSTFGNKLGNIDRTVADNSFWRNQVYDASPTGANWAVGDYKTKLIGAMDTLLRMCRDGSDKPDIILASPYFYQYYSDLVRDKQRVTSKEMADLGFDDVITYNGIPFVYEQDLADTETTARAYFINSKYLEFVTHPKDDFTAEPFVEMFGQKGKVGGIGFTGQLIASNCQRQGVIFGVK